MQYFRPRRDDRERRGPPPGRRPPGFRIFISGLSRDTSWQVRISQIPIIVLTERACGFGQLATWWSP